MKKVFFGIFFTLFFVFLIVAALFVFLFLKTQTELNEKQAQLTSALEDVAELEADKGSTPAPTEDDSDGLLQFEDVGADILVQYPESWELSIDTDLTVDFADEPYGRVLNDYDVLVKKGSATLTFSRILGAVDGFGSGLKNSEYDIVEISDSIVRYAIKGTNQWSYSESVECADLTLFLEEAPANYTACVGSFFPDFANIGATQVTIGSSDTAILTEADAIVLSTQ